MTYRKNGVVQCPHDIVPRRLTTGGWNREGPPSAMIYDASSLADAFESLHSDLHRNNKAAIHRVGLVGWRTGRTGRTGELGELLKIDLKVAELKAPRCSQIVAR